MKNSIVTCAVCAHQFPAAYVRERGIITCRCGLRIACERVASWSGVLRALLVLFATALLFAVAGTLARLLVS